MFISWHKLYKRDINRIKDCLFWSFFWYVALWERLLLHPELLDSQIISIPMQSCSSTNTNLPLWHLRKQFLTLHFCQFPCSTRLTRQSPLHGGWPHTPTTLLLQSAAIREETTEPADWGQLHTSGSQDAQLTQPLIHNLCFFPSF